MYVIFEEVISTQGGERVKHISGAKDAAKIAAIKAGLIVTRPNWLGDPRFNRFWDIFIELLEERGYEINDRCVVLDQEAENKRYDRYNNLRNRNLIFKAALFFVLGLLAEFFFDLL